MNIQSVINIIRFPALAVLRSFDLLVAIFTENKDVLEPADFPFLQTLYDNKHIFLQEYQELIKGTKIYRGSELYKSANEQKVNSDDCWQVFPMLLFNYTFNENIKKCPQTFKILSQIPGCTSIMFSILRPGKHGLPHRGVYRGVYRCLFTITMSDGGDCWIKVNGKKIPFRAGEAIVFDDCALHEVKNETEAPRVSVYLDLYRKLPFPLNIINNIFYSILRHSYVLGIMNAYTNFEKETFGSFHPNPPLLK